MNIEGTRVAIGSLSLRWPKAGRRCATFSMCRCRPDVFHMYSCAVAETAPAPGCPDVVNLRRCS